MADEFPTLEFVLAACAAGLTWRAFRLFWADRVLTSQLGSLRHPEVDTGATPSSAYLGLLWRVAAEEHERARKTERPDRSHVAERVHERAARMRRRLQGASARDLLGCAVLGGASLYAGAGQLGVAKALFILGGLCSGLLLLSVLLRMRLSARLEQAEKQVIELFRPGAAQRSVRPPSVSTRPPAPTDPRARCPACGNSGVVHLETVAELGTHLTELGLRSLLRCPSCGHVEGRIRPASHP